MPMAKRLKATHTLKRLNIIALFILAVTMSVGMSFTIMNQATAASGDSGTWWDTAQNGGLDTVGQAYGNDTNQPRDIRGVVVDIIRIVLGFLGLISVILIVYAGFRWMTSGGNEETVSSSKKILIAGVIGLVIILSAYALADLIITQIYNAANGS